MIPVVTSPDVGIPSEASRLDTAECPGQRLLAALIAVESGGNDRAVNPSGAMGPLQIRPIVLRDVQRITGQRFTASDTLDRGTACRIAVIYLSHYVTERRLGRRPTARDYTLVWRHGPAGWAKDGPSDYWNRVGNLISP